MPLKQAETITPRNNLTNDGQALRRETPKYVRDTEEHGAGQYPPMFRAGTLHGKGAEETLRRPVCLGASCEPVLKCTRSKGSRTGGAPAEKHGGPIQTPFSKRPARNVHVAETAGRARKGGRRGEAPRAFCGAARFPGTRTRVRVDSHV